MILSPNFSSKRRNSAGESGAAPQITKRSVFASASSAPGACSSAASIVGTEEKVTGSKLATSAQNLEAEKRSHIATWAPSTSGITVVTTCALTWKSGSTIPSVSPRESGSGSPSCQALARKLAWPSIAPLGRPVVPEV